MTLLDEMKAAILDDRRSLAGVLRQAMVLADTLDYEPLKQWVRHELSGYQKEELPSYRIISCFIRCDIVKEGFQYTDHIPPRDIFPESIRESLYQVTFSQGIGGIAAILSATNDNEIRMASHTPYLRQVISQSTRANCISAWQSVPRPHIEAILDEVRNRLLELVLELQSSEIRDDINSNEVDIEAKQAVQQIFYTVFGSEASNVSIGGSQHIQIRNTPGDIESLTALFAQYGIDADDLKSLKDALYAEPEIPDETSFGPKVAQWIGLVVSKAASGVWDIGIGAGGDLLAKAISKYYGF